MFRLAQVALLTVLMTATASAATMQAVRQGLLCEQADALARLTLPDGSSRTSVPRPNRNDIALKDAGGCIDIPDGAVVEVQSRRKNTSIVTFNDQGVRKTYITPNIDYTENRPSTPPIVGQAGDSHDRPAPDVAGLRLGMTLQQAKAIIGQGYSYEDRDPALLGITGGPDLGAADFKVVVAARIAQPEQQSAADRSVEDYVLIALRDRLFFIERGQSFGKADRLNAATMQAALAENYGTASLGGSGGGPGGAPATRISMPSGCIPRRPGWSHRRTSKHGGAALPVVSARVFPSSKATGRSLFPVRTTRRGCPAPVSTPP